jgi:hypothetical protein
MKLLIAKIVLIGCRVLIALIVLGIFIFMCIAGIAGNTAAIGIAITMVVVGLVAAYTWAEYEITKNKSKEP